jgi:hypothetical protein
MYISRIITWKWLNIWQMWEIYYTKINDPNKVYKQMRNVRHMWSIVIILKDDVSNKELNAQILVL